MRARAAAWCIAIAAAGWSGALLAHHSISLVEIATPVWVKGTVVDFHARAPHVMVTLQAQDKDGLPQKWNVEGPNLARLERMGADGNFLKPGDAIEVCGFRLKQPYTRADFIHGQVLVMPDGHMRHFGPYGKLDNCIRPGDGAAKWVKFLKDDPLALPSWCSGRSYTRVASVAAPAVVEEIERQMGNPCH